MMTSASRFEEFFLHSIQYLKSKTEDHQWKIRCEDVADLLFITHPEVQEYFTPQGLSEFLFDPPSKLHISSPSVFQSLHHALFLLLDPQLVE